MNKDFKKGNIVEFDNKIGTIVVLGNLMYNDNYYILACPIKGEKNNIKANLKNILLLVEKENEIYVEDNHNIIEKVVPQILKDSNINI